MGDGWGELARRAEAFCEAEDKKHAKALRRRIADAAAARRRGKTSTDAAIDQWHQSSARFAPGYFDILKSDLDDPDPFTRPNRLPGGRGESWPGRGLPRALLDDFPVIDMRVLQRRKLVGHPYDRTVWGMKWAFDDRPEIEVHALFNPTNPLDPYLRLEWFDADWRWQIVRLDNPHGNWMFFDPDSRRLCNTIVFARAFSAPANPSTS